MDTKNAQLWQAFSERLKLSSGQLSQFERYYTLLLEANELFNLTSLTQLSSVIHYHFEDSLALAYCVPMSDVRVLADIGTGAGFPGVPLKIVYPDLKVILIEVTHKKVAFLEDLIVKLGLQDIEVYQLDWRMFLRHAHIPVDLFCARASLQFRELLRIFRPASEYRDAQLAYWASIQWVPEEYVIPFIKKECPYQVGHKKRKLVVLESGTH